MVEGTRTLLDKSSKKILLIGNCYTTVASFRKEIVIDLVNQGYQVFVAFPNHSHGEKESGEDFAKDTRCSFIEIGINRRSINVLGEIKTIFSLRKLIDEIKPDCILLYTIKPNIYAGLIAARRNIPYIINVTGLGSGMNGGIVSKLLKTLYIRSMNRASVVFFQNKSDHQFLVESGYHGENAQFIPGSGVNLQEFKELPYPNSGSVVFMYTARVMKEKGIEEFLGAAKAFADNSNVMFEICGDCEDEYSEELRDLEDKNIVKYYGRVSDVRPYIERSSCVVIPTFYHEGVSNCLLEAAACGRPIITTDRPGSAETVDVNQSGYLIKEKDTQGLIKAIQEFLELPVEKRQTMGKVGRRKMEQEFDRKIVVDRYGYAIEGILEG